MDNYYENIKCYKYSSFLFRLPLLFLGCLDLGLIFYNFSIWGLESI